MPQERILFERCGGYRLCILDLSGIQDSDLGVEIITEAQRRIAEHPPGSLRMLTDVSGARMTLPGITALQKLARSNEAYVTRSAIFGLSLPHRVALRQIRRLTGRDIREFTNRNEALEYLRS